MISLAEFDVAFRLIYLVYKFLSTLLAQIIYGMVLQA